MCCYLDGIQENEWNELVAILLFRAKTGTNNFLLQTITNVTLGLDRFLLQHTGFLSGYHSTLLTCSMLNALGGADLEWTL